MHPPLNSLLMHFVALSNYCLTFFPLPCLSVASPALLPVCRHIICNCIYQNSLREIITNNIQPAQKSLLIMWSQKQFNQIYLTIENVEKCLVLRFWSLIVLPFNCFAHIGQYRDFYILVLQLIQESRMCWTLKSIVIQRPKPIENWGNMRECTLWNALSHSQFSV